MSLPETFVRDFHHEDAVRSMTFKRLGHTDMYVSTLSFGAAGLGGIYGAVDDSPEAIVTYALKRGLNFIDTSPWYGNGRSEECLGQVLPSLPRESFYIATKVGRYESDVRRMFNFSADHVTRGFESSLERMGLDYVDLLQVHDVEFAPTIDQVINETLPALDKIRRAGKARYIGITGYPLSTLKEIIERSTVKIDTVLSYCRCCLNDTELLSYIPWFREHGVGVINASALAMGLFTSQGPPAWHPAHMELRQATAHSLAHCQDNGVDFCKLALRYSLTTGSGVDTTLCSFNSIQMVRENLETFRTPLTEREGDVLDYIISRFMKTLKAVNWEGAEPAKYRRKLKELQNQ